MIYCRQFIVLLFSVIAISQLSPTIAFSQECIDDTLGFPLTERVNSTQLRKGILDTCDGENNCYLDLSTISTNGQGGQNFARMCSKLNGTVYDGSTYDGSELILIADCSSFKVYYRDLYLCLPPGCKFLTASDVWDVWDVMLNDAGFDGECSDYAASSTPVPTGVVVAIVVVFILICVGVGTYFARRHVKS